MTKWHKFHSKYTPMAVGDSDEVGQSNLVGDWSRLGQTKATINGRSLKSLMQEHNYQFNTKDDVKRFFKEVILNELDSSIDKEEAVRYLMTSFHQGGLMYPVSAPLTVLAGENGLQPAAFAENVEKQINIMTTTTGFKVQELYTSKKFIVMPTAPQHLQDRADEDLVILPDSDKNYIISAGATIDLNFSKNARKPDMTVEVSAISYGSAAVQSALDIRHFGHKIVDFFRNLLGLNSVRDLSESKQQESSQTNTADASTSETPGEPFSP